MRRVCVSLLLVGFLALPAAGQCPGGCCPGGSCPPTFGGAAQFEIPVDRPTPAWRYESARGHWVAVVRIYCQDTASRRSIGSGVLVRVGRRVVVLTARHVVKDAQSMIVQFYTGVRSTARVLLADATWDCAVLAVSNCPAVIKPAEMAWGQQALLHQGDRLESCGYGPDGRLAVNGGLFMGYRRSTLRRQGPDDWMVLSGRARGGDSGGPIFDAAGRVVGVLWGTDGTEVVGVQAGRVHVLLREAVADAYQQKQILERTPTPPMAEPLVPIERPPTADNSAPCAPPVMASSAPPLLPWRGEAERRDNEQRAAIDRLIELERLRQAQPPVVVMPPGAPTPGAPPVAVPEAPPLDQPEPSGEQASPLLAGLCVLGGAAVGFVIYFANEKGTANG